MTANAEPQRRGSSRSIGRFLRWKKLSLFNQKQRACKGKNRLSRTWALRDLQNRSFRARERKFAKMDEFATIWQEHILVRSKPSSIRSVKSHLNVHTLPHFGKRGLDEIGVQAQQFFVTKLAQANLSRKMILNVLSTLASILQTAKGWGYVCQMVDYKTLAIQTEEVQTEARFFTLEEVGSEPRNALAA
jgi:hypothetical protein